MKPCPAESRWIDLALETLPAAEATDLRDHAVSCSDCAVRLKETQSLVALGRTIPTPPPSHLADRVWRSLPEPAPPCRLWRPVTVSLAAAATIGALCLLPGTLTRPTPTFARVEEAMDGIRSVAWHESVASVHEDGMEATGGDRTHVVRLDPLRHVSWDGPTGDAAQLIEVTEAGTLWAVFQKRRLWVRRLRTELARREWMLRSVILPQDLKGLGDESVSRGGFRRSPWVRTSEVREGRRLLRFTCEETQKTKGKQDRARLTVWADPASFRIVRRERYVAADPSESNLISGHGRVLGWRAISDDYRYNDEAPVAPSLPEPAEGTAYVFIDRLDRAMRHDTPPEWMPQIAALVRRTVAAWNRGDAPRFAAEWDFGTESLDARFGRGGGEAERGAAWRTKVGTNRPWRAWTIDAIDAGRALAGPRIRRSGDAFPPEDPARNRYEVTVDGKAALGAGKAPVRLLVGLTLRRGADGLKIVGLTRLSVPSPRR